MKKSNNFSSHALFSNSASESGQHCSISVHNFQNRNFENKNSPKEIPIQISNNIDNPKSQFMVQNKPELSNHQLIIFKNDNKQKSFDNNDKIQHEKEIFPFESDVFEKNSLTNPVINQQNKTSENNLFISNSSKFNIANPNQDLIYSSYCSDIKNKSISPKAFNDNGMIQLPTCNATITQPYPFTALLSSPSFNISIGNSALNSKNSQLSVNDSNQDYYMEQNYEISKKCLNSFKFDAVSSENANNCNYPKSILNEIDIDELFLNYPTVFDEIFFSRHHFKFDSIEQIENDLKFFCEQLLKIGEKSNNQPFSTTIKI
jgi:hypothetical protein